MNSLRITLPEFDGSDSHNDAPIHLNKAVKDQLRDYVKRVAMSYNNNHFHSFEHASHVAMSVKKLMSRIVAPSEIDGDKHAKKLHDHTYGITSDPLTQFACIFSALIHVSTEISSHRFS